MILKDELQLVVSLMGENHRADRIDGHHTCDDATVGGRIGNGAEEMLSFVLADIEQAIGA